MTVYQKRQTTLSKPSEASLKKLAWAYGCAKKGSDEEKRLERLLIERIFATEKL